ncbi:MAG TPA: hypothetical protein ENH90_01765 [bacterium]|nr:hypothetical protein [bacterium]
MPPKSVTIAIPTYKNMPSMFFMNFLALYTETKKHFKTNLIFCDGTYIEQSRNTLVDLFLKRPADYLFFIDSDMLVPPNTISLLCKQNKDMVSGLYFGRSQQGETHPMVSIKNEGVYSRLSSLSGELEEVDAVGFGCVLIKREVIEKISKQIGEQPFFQNFFKTRTDIIGEDYYFCELAIKAEFSIFVDTSLQCGHIGGIIDLKYYYANR